MRELWIYLAGTVEEDVVIVLVTYGLLQPVQVLQQELHTKDEATIGSKVQLIIFHGIVNTDSRVKKKREPIVKKIKGFF